MANDPDSRTVAKLVLLQQACCDQRLAGSHHGVLAVILDACFDKERSFLGPLCIGRITNRNARTVHDCIKDLVLHGYIRTERRTNRSTWYYPNFEYAEQSGKLVVWEDGKPMRVCMPVSIVGAQTRIDRQPNIGSGSTAHPMRVSGTLNAGLQRTPMRVYTPEEAVIEAIKETIEEAVTAAPHFPDDQEQERKAKQEAKRLADEQREQQQCASIQSEYLQFKITQPEYAARMVKTFPRYLAHLVDEHPT
jgi:hypothetical protein